jgi:signal transduction histidine kinase
MIEIVNFLAQDFEKDAPKELMLLSFISQSFFQPFSLEENLLAILSALTSGSGVGFNRAMLFLAEGTKLRGRLWLGPRSAEEALYIWDTLSTPGIGYAEIIEYNRSLVSRPEDNLSRRIQSLSYDLQAGQELVPSLATTSRNIVLVRDARHEPRLADDFREIIGLDEFLCIPLLAQDDVMGEVILDNAINRAPIEARDIKLASLCGLVAGNAIALARMHRRVTDMERLAAMGEMAAFVTHELRNPLAAVGGFVEQMADPRATDRKKKRNLRIIRGEVKRLEDILFKIAHIWKVELKQSPPCDLGSVVRSILAGPEIRRKKRHRVIVPDIEDNLPPVLCDTIYAAEVARNILDNAVDATPDRGLIRVRCFFHDSEGRVVLSVEDSGAGIPPTIQDKIFTPFFSTKKNGMGLGLLFVKRVMDACGGRVEWESGESRGSVFRLYFPVDRRGST